MKQADILIAGAGPAGLSAAIYVQRSGKKAIVLEGNTYGGQIINTPEVENYPGIQKISGFDFATALYGQAAGLGAEVVFDRGIGVEKTAGGFILKGASGEEYAGSALIIATGARNRHLGISGEDELLGRGISYCATCDGAFFKGKEVAVQGGGNTALEDAMFLSQYCSHVYLIHRREGFRGEPGQLEALRKKENVTFLLNRTVTELEGAEKLTGVVMTDTRTGEKTSLPVSGLFVAIGQEPDAGVFREMVSVDEKGYIIADESCRTSEPGIFAAGDVRTKEVRQLATAASDGAVAALAAVKHITEMESAS